MNKCFLNHLVYIYKLFLFFVLWAIALYIFFSSIPIVLLLL